MELVESSLPWSGAPVQSTGELRSHFAAALPPPLRYHLPRSIVLLADPGVSEIMVSEWLAEVADWLVVEFSTRETRRREFERVGRLQPDEMTAMLTAAHKQPWVLYFSVAGGLGPTDTIARGDGKGGVLPCSSMRNHGVARTRRRGESTCVWLVTARKQGQAWDMDSDIGHESAHAAFAPMPLFAQSIPGDLDALPLARAEASNGVTADHVARMCYLYTELAVVAVRGVWNRNGVRVDPVSGPEIWEIGAAALRALAYTRPFLADPDVSGLVEAIFHRGTDNRVLSQARIDW